VTIQTLDDHWILIDVPDSLTYTYNCGGKDPCECLHLRYHMEPYVKSVAVPVPVEEGALDIIRKANHVIMEGTQEECVNRMMEMMKMN